MAWSPFAPPPTLPCVAIGTRVRALRQAAGFSREALAERSGLSLNYVRSIEYGERDPSLSTLEALATGLGVRIADLVDAAPGLSPAAVEAARLFEQQTKPVQRAVLDLMRATRRAR